MKRRTFGLLASCSLLATQAGLGWQALADTADVSKQLGGPALTPMGSERAANADGSIPAWTGGLTTLPAGVQPGDYVPELFPNEQPVLVINSSNMSQHADRLTEGVMAMMTKYGFSIKVYPTHRTQAMPQWVYDNIAKNAVTAKFAAADPVGGRLGFTGAYGGMPFPIPDTSNPFAAGAQLMWNHSTGWYGSCYHMDAQSWVVANGHLALASNSNITIKYPYYNPDGSVESNKDNALKWALFQFTAPADLVGQQILGRLFTDPAAQPQQNWQLLNGEGRVRRAPELQFDTPSSNTGGIANWDEVDGFLGSLEQYDWKYITKKEMYIPYNNNGLFVASPQEALLEHFLNPDLVRWELHRVWVVEATLHPGYRNVLARRRFYLDEDICQVQLADAWDAEGNLFKVNMLPPYCYPSGPGNMQINDFIYNLQTDQYVCVQSLWNQKPGQISGFRFVDFADIMFDPGHMAAGAAY